jgi:hypothetical protein
MIKKYPMEKEGILGCGARITEDSNSSTNLKLAMPLYQIFY